MTRSFISRALRAVAVVSLIATAAACGGSGESRQRNQALPETVDFDVTWVPESHKFQLTAEVDKIVVRFYGAADNLLAETYTDSKSRVASFTLNENFADQYAEPVTSMKFVAQFLNSDGTVADETELAFEPAVGAVRSASLPAPEGYYSTDSTVASSDSTPAASDSTVAGEPADFVLHFPKDVTVVTQIVQIPDDLAPDETWELTAMVTKNPAGPDATLQLGVDYLTEDLSQIVAQGFGSADVTVNEGTYRPYVLANIKPGDAVAANQSVSFVRVTVRSDAKTTDPGFSGAIVTSVSLKRGDKELLQNPNFDEGDKWWSSSTTFWENCEEAQGYNPCVSDKPVTMIGGSNPADTVPDTTPVSAPDTTPVSTPDTSAGNDQDLSLIHI